MDLREMLRQEVEGWKRVAELNGRAPRRMLEQEILEHGEVYELDREASAALGPGILKNCFENAAQVSLWDEKYTYVEGFAFRRDGITPVHHAWVVNVEGKALDVTWRDGGTDCGHCVDGERPLDVDEDDEDEDLESARTETCPFCEGTGEREEEHATLEGAQYIGIPVDSKTLAKIISRNRLWGALHSPEDLQDVLAAKR